MIFRSTIRPFYGSSCAIGTVVAFLDGPMALVNSACICRGTLSAWYGWQRWHGLRILGKFAVDGWGSFGPTLHRAHVGPRVVASASSGDNRDRGYGLARIALQFFGDTSVRAEAGARKRKDRS